MEGNETALRRLHEGTCQDMTTKPTDPTPTTPPPTYDVDHFIRKFEGIPEEKWCTGTLTDPEGRSCAFGHCGVLAEMLLIDDKWSQTPEAIALAGLLGGEWRVVDINDSHYQFCRGPRARVLAALYDIKAKQKATTK